jgi:uncharacterized protein
MTPDVTGRQAELEPTILDTELASLPGEELDTSLDFAAEPAPKPSVEPVAASERYFAVDVLRGFALLGILAMNIVAFGWPEAAYGNPMRGGGFTGLDRGIWIFNHLFFEAKMMTIFSMLFGAGLVLMDQRAEAKGARVRNVYYRRILWLLAIGLVHSYLIWNGDILVLYAETGLFLYFFRNLKPRTLIILGIAAMLVLVPLLLGFTAAFDYMKAATARVEAQTQAGQQPSRLDQRAHDIWTRNLRDNFRPNPEEKAKAWAKELAAYRGDYPGIVKHRAFGVLMVQTIGFLLGGGFFAASRMLVGMGLMKLGVFSAQRSQAFYRWMIALGYGLGLPVLVYDTVQLIQHEFSSSYMLHGGVLYNVFASLVVAFGHVGLLMLIVQSGALTWLTDRLAAVGRMALSNYLTHSLVCTTLFYGYGFGYFGYINRTGLVAIVLAIWIFQLIISPIWLRYYRFGPAEWLWRSLTYGRLQTMKQPSVQAVAVGS